MKGTDMSEQSTPTAPQEAPAEEVVTPTSVADLIAFQREQEADRAARQAAATEAAERAVEDTLKATADAARAEYLTATEPTRAAKGYVERHQAYDRRFLRFIEGTAAATSKDAKDKAKALPAYKDRPASDIETRAI